MKKFLSVLAVVCLMLLVLSSAAFADEIEDVEAGNAYIPEDTVINLILLDKLDSNVNKKGDTVKVMVGDAVKCKGKEGKVLSVDHKNGRVVVEGVNKVTKHTKPSAANPNGGIIEKEAPIDISNVMYVHKGKTTKVGFKMDGDKKVRFAKSTGEVID